MTHKPAPTFIAMAAAVDLPEGEGAPEWVHLLPAMHGAVETYDGRGPYRVGDATALIAASMDDARGVAIDENHATQLAAPKGGEAPARGWINQMEARADGIWGQVKWTDAGRALVADRAYRGLSPVFHHDASGAISRIITASLVNRPNLRGLSALHMETAFMDMESIASALGLEATATAAQIVTAIKALTQPDTAMQSALAEIGTALGVEGDTATLVAAAKANKTAATTSAAIPALQAEIATLTTSLNALSKTASQTKAEAFVDGEIKRGRAGVKPLRDHYVAMHMEDAARVEKELGALPVLNATGMGINPPTPKDGAISKNAEQTKAMHLIGVDPAKYAATLAAERATEEAR